MRITQHRLEGAEFLPAHYTGEVITPEIVILHDTAGRLTKGNSAAYLASKNPAEVSVHFVIERDGTIVQLVQTNRRANHAGRSNYHGREWCNAFSIGIEMVNPGRMTASDRAAGGASAWWGQVFNEAEYDIRYVKTQNHGSGFWMAYTEGQLTALINLLDALFRDVPTLKDITTHWYVSPGRKVDTNPLFPLDHVRARVLGRDDPADAAAEAGSIADPAGTPEAVRVETEGDTLNLRRWPSFNPNVIATIPDGALVPVLREGAFDGRRWLRVIYGGHEGWIVASYTDAVDIICT